MVFIDNKYTRTYYNIVRKYLSTDLNAVYTEKHHIVPKSLGGSNDPDNIVRLPYKAHFVCHLLLVKMTTGKDRARMLNAFWGMHHMKRKDQDRNHGFKVHSRLYESLKTEYKKSRKNFRHTEESKKKIGDAHRGKTLSDEHKALISKLRKESGTSWNKGIPMSDTHKANLSAARTGKSWGYKHSDETKAKMSDWQKGQPKPKFPCPHCGKEASLMNLRKWHGDNCKLAK